MHCGHRDLSSRRFKAGILACKAEKATLVAGDDSQFLHQLSQAVCGVGCCHVAQKNGQLVGQGQLGRLVEQVAGPMLEDPALPMSTLIYKIVRPEEIDDPNHVKTVFDRHGNALYFSRAPIPFQRNPEEQIKPTYYKHLGFYAYRKGFLLTFVGLPEGEWERFEKLEQLRALEYGYTIRVVLTNHDSIEVDTPKDIERVEQLLRAQR